MATRSRIGLELADGSVLSVYHHWDGYPEWLGRILKIHYNIREKVAELIDGGDMSSCWTDTPFDHDGKSSEYGPNYYSQRGEDCPPRHDASLMKYLSYGEVYAYLYTLNDEWICYNMHKFEDDKEPERIEIPAGVPLC